MKRKYRIGEPKKREIKFSKNEQKGQKIKEIPPEIRSVG
jgi:hypothetical protein